MNDEITLTDFRRWYSGYAMLDVATAMVIEEQLRNPESEASLLLWLFDPDFSNPPPSLSHLKLRDDQLPQESEPNPETEDIDDPKVDPHHFRMVVEDGIKYMINSLNECIPVVPEGILNMDDYIPIFPCYRTSEFNSYSCLRTQEDHAVWGNDSLGA